MVLEEQALLVRGIMVERDEEFQVPIMEAAVAVHRLQARAVPVLPLVVAAQAAHLPSQVHQ